MKKVFVVVVVVFHLLVLGQALAHTVQKPGGLVYSINGCSGYFPLFAFADQLTVSSVSWSGQCRNGLMDGAGRLSVRGTNAFGVNVAYVYDGIISSGVMSDYKGFFAVKKDGMPEPIAFVGYFLKKPVSGDIISFVPFEGKWVVGYVTEDFEKGKISPRSVDMLNAKLPVAVLKNYASNVLTMMHSENVRKYGSDSDKIIHFMELIRQTLDNFVYLGKGLKAIRQSDIRLSDLDWGL
ncbi:MAG TPA: hypothetical protein PKC79_03330 [Solidesulfovibrio magneticus]|nr:hypothetical protein [Solidesulfovibrio magneticus]